MSEFTGQAADPHQESWVPRLLRTLTASDSLASLPSSMAVIYKPSGESHPHRIAIATEATALRILCSVTGIELAALEGPEPQTSVTNHHRPDGRPVIVLKSVSNHVWAWDGDDYSLIFKRTLGGGVRLQHLYTYTEPEEGNLRVVVVERAHTSPRLHVLDGDTGETLHSLVLADRIHRVGGYVWSDGGALRQRFVAAGTRGVVVVIDPEAGQVVQQMRGHANYTWHWAASSRKTARLWLTWWSPVSPTTTRSR
jgi:hypothetical protein